MNSTPSRLGELLLRSRLIDQPQLTDALRAQASGGGRIGSNLVQLGHLSVDTLTEQLARQLRVPAATPPMLQQIDRQTVALIPGELCAEYCVLPLGREGRTIHAAMLDPDRLDQIDLLATRLGAPAVRSYALAQLRLLYQLEVHYGIARPPRYLRREAPPQRGEPDRRRYLAPTEAQQRQLQATPTPTPVLPQTGPAMPAVPPRTSQTGPAYPASRSALSVPKLQRSSPIREGRTGPEYPVAADRAGPGRPPPPPAARTSSSGLARPAERAALRASGSGLHATVRPLKGRLDLADPDTAAGGSPTVAPVRPSALLDDGFQVDITVDEPMDDALARVVQRVTDGLAGAVDRDTVVRRLLVPILPRTSLTLLLLPRRSVAVALAAWGADASSQAEVRSLAVPLVPTSLLTLALQRGGVVSGQASDDLSQQMIADHLGAPTPKEACVALVSVDGEPVNLLCVQSAESFPVGSTAALTQLVDSAAAAYRRLAASSSQP